jgi:hypothetical protein
MKRKPQGIAAPREHKAINESDFLEDMAKITAADMEAPGHTDLMVSPEAINEVIAGNPPPGEKAVELKLDAESISTAFEEIRRDVTARLDAEIARYRVGATKLLTAAIREASLERRHADAGILAVADQRIRELLNVLPQATEIAQDDLRAALYLLEILLRG